MVDELRGIERILDAVALRQRVIASNIANQNTPGYLRRVVRFEEALKASGNKGDWRGTVEESTTGPRQPNGNNVQLEDEWRNLEKNQALYDAFTRALGAKFRRLQAAIRGRV
jgi:flagellar basal-body rod protein FlgB